MRGPHTEKKETNITGKPRGGITGGGGGGGGGHLPMI